jgi:two-component system chemotaxis response regulator CheB
MLFNSAAVSVGPYAVSVLLTGMGSDGAQGMQRLKERGAHSIAQDEATCVVYGMPKSAFDLGVVDEQLPLDRIPNAILRAVQAKAAAGPPRPSAAHS